MPRFLVKLNRCLAKLETCLLLTLLSTMLSLSVFQIILRAGWQKGIVWIDPLCRSLVLWLALLGGARAVFQNKSIKIDMAERLLPRRYALQLNRTLNGIGSLLCIYLTWIALSFVQQERDFADPYLGPILMWHVQTVIPLGFALMAYHFGIKTFFLEDESSTA